MLTEVCVYGIHVAWQPSPGDRPMYDGPDVPPADLPEDITGPEPQLVPLDVSTLHKVPGYETVGYYTDCEYRISSVTFKHVHHHVSVIIASCGVYISVDAGTRAPCGHRVERIDPLRFLTVCRKRRLNQALSVLSLSLSFF